MPEPFDPRRAMEIAAELAADVASGTDYAGALERILAARAASQSTSESEVFRALLDSLARLGEQASLAAHLDEMTGLANRRGFDVLMRKEIERSYKGGRPISALAIGIDHFERVTADGPEATERVVKVVADLLRGCLRHLDIAARVGPSTFRVLLPTAALEDAREVAERCRCAIAAAYVPDTGALTATFGVATLPDHAANGPGLLQAADAALSTGVRRGRNCVATALPLRQ